MDAELVFELKKCLEKYWRTMALPPAERAPYAAGITKLEQRIEQLRAATGLDTDQFVNRVREIMRLLYGVVIPMDALDVAEVWTRLLPVFGSVTRMGRLPLSRSWSGMRRKPGECLNRRCCRYEKDNGKAHSFGVYDCF